MLGPTLMGIFLWGLGTFVCIEALDLSLGLASRPGPGFVSFGLGLILVVLSSAYLIQVRLRSRERVSFAGQKKSLFLAVAALCLYAAALNRLGYLITTFLLFVFWLALIERKKWSVVLPLACVAVAGVYFFNILFSVQLPRGLLAGILR